MNISCKLFGHKMIGLKHSAVCKRCDYTDFTKPEVDYTDFIGEIKLSPDYLDGLYMDGKKLNFIDYNKTDMKKDKFVKITKEQIDFLKQYGVVVHNEWYNYYHLPQIFAIDINDADPKEVHITKNFTEVAPDVWNLFKNTGLLKVEIGQSESEKESTNYIPKQVKQQPEINRYCLDIASKLPNTCLKELFDNANKIKEYLDSK